MSTYQTHAHIACQYFDTICKILPHIWTLCPTYDTHENFVLFSTPVDSMKIKKLPALALSGPVPNVGVGLSVRIHSEVSVPGELSQKSFSKLQKNTASVKEKTQKHIS